MEAVATRMWGTESLAGRRVAVQGVGKVGSALVEFLVQEDADLIVADIVEESAQALVDQFGVKAVGPEEILFEHCDILSPCSLGGSINEETIPKLQCRAIVGSANTQLATQNDAERVAAAGIVYVPDFVANAGGLIHVSAELDEFNARLVTGRIAGIYDAVLSILDRSAANNITPNDAAVRFAQDRIDREGNGVTFRHGGQ